MFRRLHTRLQLLLAIVVVAAIAATVVAFGTSMRESNAERAARALHAQVVAADALLAMPDRDAALAQLRVLGLRWAPELPPGERPSLPLLIRTEAMVGARLPGRPLRLSGTPAELWVQARPQREGEATGWIGIPVLGDGEPFRRGALLALVAIGTLVLFASLLFARSLTRPLRRLAEAAPRIVAGDTPPAVSPTDSAEIVELQRALADAAERTRAAARDRELMLAGLSHDMRTPLARMRYALALDAGMETQTRDGIERDIDELDAMVGQFIDYVRDGRDESERTVDLGSLLAEVAADEARRGRDWKLKMPSSAPLRGRPLALRRAVVNLFENAARHGAAPFEVELIAIPEPHSGSRGAAWRVCVRDRGPGVPEDRLSELGRPFHRIDRARGTPGSGLGLASVARVAAVHHGRLLLRNRDGGGLEAELQLFDAPS